MLLEEKNNAYKIIVKRLLKKCQKLQTENERLVLRTNKVRSLIRRRTADVAILKRRLDTYNDGWRVLPVVVPHPKRKIEQKRGPKPKAKETPVETEPKVKKPRKQRTKKDTTAAITVNKPPIQIPVTPITPVTITSVPKTSKVGIMNINPIPPLPYQKLPVQPIKKPPIVIDSFHRLLKNPNFTIKH